jgi:hypothetical protein
MLFILWGCSDDAAATPDAPILTPDAVVTCQPQSAIGAFYRRQPNPRLVAGRHTFTDGKLDTAIADPDLRWDAVAQSWLLYFAAPHGSTFDPPGVPILRRATSTDLASWTFEDAPALAASADWDSLWIGAPSVAFNADAPADRRYLMVYSGAARMFPGYAFADASIGLAASADGKRFTRIAAAESPHGKAGLVLTGADAFPGAGGAIVTDPEIVYVSGTYHLWFSSFSCSGTSCAHVDAYGIGHATSNDGVHWSVDAAPVRTLLRASADLTTGGAKPSVVYDDVHCRWEMWLVNDAQSDTSAQPIVLDNTAGVWHATSPNATTWSTDYATRDLVWEAAASGEHLGLRAGADIAGRSTARYLVGVGFDDQNVPTGSTLPTSTGTRAGVMTLDLATRDAP